MLDCTFGRIPTPAEVRVFATSPGVTLERAMGGVTAIGKDKPKMRESNSVRTWPADMLGGGTRGDRR